MLLFLLTVGTYLASFYLKKVEIQWMGVFIAVCSIAMTVTDATLSDDETIVLTVIPFFIMLMMGKNAFSNKG